MKIQPAKSSNASGNVLFTTVILAAILGVTLSGYLLWVQSQNANVAESQAWNNALGLAEAGIEEAMAQINVANGSVNPTNYGPSMSTNSWPRSQNLVGGSYKVAIQPNSPGPTITATGYTSVAYVGVPISRVVRVTTRPSTLFGNAITAQNIDMKGNNRTVERKHLRASKAHSRRFILRGAEWFGWRPQLGGSRY